MTPIAPAQLLDALAWRYATKAFDPARKIPADTWAALERALVATPSSCGLQPWKFLVVTDPALRARLRPASWNQSQVTDASHHVVFLGRTVMTEADVQKLIEATAAARGLTVAQLEGYRQMVLKTVVHGMGPAKAAEWAARQVYIALGQFMAACAVLGIDTCPMEGFEAAKYDDILGLAGGPWTSVVCCPAGYRAESDKYAKFPKVRYPVAEMVEHR